MNFDENISDLQYLPFFNVSNQELQAISGTWSCEIDEELDLYNILPNPDKTDQNDPDLILNIPTSNYFSLSRIYRALETHSNSSSLFHFNIRSLSKNVDLLNEFRYSLATRPDIIGITETKLNEKSVDNSELMGYMQFL